MGRSAGLWLFLPEEALILVIIGGAFLVMLRIASVRAVLGTVLFLVFLPALSPLIEAAFGALPAWLSLLVLVAMGFWMLQAIAATIIGRGPAEHMVGTLAADLVRLMVKAAFLPLRLVWRLIWR